MQWENFVSTHFGPEVVLNSQLTANNDVFFFALLGVIAVISYFFGCFNGAVIISKYILRDDVRNHGSGNAGLTNFFRTFGGPLTLLVILLDVVKAVLAIEVGKFISLHVLGMELIWFNSDGIYFEVFAGLLVTYWAGLFCLLGHMFPCMFGFKGGKGILSGGTVAIMIDWRVALVVWGGFLVLVLLTKYVSLGSCWAGASFPFASWFVFHNLLIAVLGGLMGGLVLYMHRANIHRLLTGTENKFSLHKKKS